jgi:hypothetical protein
LRRLLLHARLGALVEAGRERCLRWANLAVGAQVSVDLAVELAERGEGGEEVHVEEAERELTNAASLLEAGLRRRVVAEAPVHQPDVMQPDADEGVVGAEHLLVHGHGPKKG